MTVGIDVCDATSHDHPGSVERRLGGDVHHVSVAFLPRLVTCDLRQRELDDFDPIFPTGACRLATKSSPG